MPGPKLIIEAARGGQVDQQLRGDPPAAVIDGAVTLVSMPADAEGRLEAPDAGQVVLAVPSPETFLREAEEVRRVIDRAGTGAEPLVIVVEAAERLRDDELAVVVGAAERSSRDVILRILGDG